MILKLKRTPGIYLVGFMGSGKSTVGRALAEELGWSFFDLDQEIEDREGVTISDLFESRGEEAFREMEAAALRNRVRAVEKGRPQVIALGGGAFCREENFSLTSNNGITIWLDCPIEVIAERIAQETHRPLARDPERMRSLFEQRQPAYARADYRIEARDQPNEVVSRILALPIFVP